MQDKQRQHVAISASLKGGYSDILSLDALDFLNELHNLFNQRRLELLDLRNREPTLDFLEGTESIRANESWRVAPLPKDLECRWVEITGPTDRKMMINAMNSGANVYMTDLEDSCSPTWENVIEGQINIRDTVNGSIRVEKPDGEFYELQENPATFLIRPRGLHLTEKHILINDTAISASLFDFGLFMFHNAKALVKKGSGPYCYLPKLEHYLEARLWNEIFIHCQERLGIPQGSIRATVLIETLPAAFQMEEILYELRDHSSGLNAGRWDYIFSIIKTCHPTLPDRRQVEMTVPFLRAFTNLLVQTCHKRGAQAIGGMSAFIPERQDPEVTEKALRKVREDKLREVGDGFDGTWVAHPDLVKVAKEIFEKGLQGKPNQLGNLRNDFHINPKELITFDVPGGKITEEGLRHNIHVSLLYMMHWLNGRGAVAIDHLMEDAATAEISRIQVWQWIHHDAHLDDGRKVDSQLVKTMIQEEWKKLGHDVDAARSLFESLVFDRDCAAFLTLTAYERL